MPTMSPSVTAMSMVEISLEKPLTKAAFFSTSSAGSRPAAAATSAPAPVFRAAPAAEPDSELSDTPKFQAFDRLTDLVNYLEQKKMPLAEYALKNDVSVSEFSNGFIKMTVSEKIHPDFILILHKILSEASGLTWKIELSRGALGVTLADLERAAEEEEKRNIMEYPLVKAIMAEFKGAKIETATRRISETDDDEEIDFGSDNNELIYDEEN